METIFLSTENSKTNVSHRFWLTLADKLSLKDHNKNMALANLSIYYTWKNIKSAYNKNNVKSLLQLGMIWFDLLNGSYSISDIQNYIEYIIKKHQTMADNPPTNKIKTGLFSK